VIGVFGSKEGLENNPDSDFSNRLLNHELTSSSSPVLASGSGSR
jgi:hypothetical protein